MAILSDEEKTALRTWSALYFYMPYSFVMKWNFKTSKVEAIEGWRECMISMASFMLILILGLGSLAVIAWYLWFPPPPNYGWINVFLLFCSGFGVCFAGIIGMTIFIDRHNILAFLNQSLKLCDKIERENGSCEQNPPAKADKSGIFLTILIGYFGISPFWVTAFAIVTNVDVGYFVLGELGHDSYPIFILNRFIRGSVVFWSWAELGRTLSFVTFWLFILFMRVVKICRMLLNPGVRSEQYVDSFRGLQLIYKKIQLYIETGLYLFLFAAFWMLVGSVIFCLKLRHLVPPLMFHMVVALTFMLILCHCVAIPILCETGDLLLGVWTSNLKRIRCRWALHKSKMNRWNWMRARALLPIRLRYGKFLVFDKQFKTEYFYLVLERCIDGLLSF